MTIQPHPQLEELRLACRQRRKDLRDALDEQSRLSVEVRPQLTELYDSHFGDMEKELQSLAIQCADISRRVELLTIKIARGERLTSKTIEIVNAVVDKEFARFKERLASAFIQSQQDRDAKASIRGNEPEDHELVAIYRTLAKRLHPDSGADSHASPSQWHRLQQAYRQRNISLLRSMLGSGVVDLDRDIDDMTIDQLAVEKEKLETKVRMEKRKLDKLLREEPFIIAADLENEHWIRTHGAELQNTIASKRKELSEQHQHYAEITGGEYNAVAGTSDEESTFEQDFIEKTYFGQR